MAFYEFAILPRDPRPGERFDDYEPEKYGPMLRVPDDWLDFLYCKRQIPCFWHTADRPGPGLDWCGVNLIPPASLDPLQEALGKDPRLAPLRELVARAKAQGRWLLNYGL